MTQRGARAARLAAAKLYCCTDARGSLEDFGAFVEQILAGGVDIVQFREKKMEAAQALTYLEVLRSAARRHDALFCVNDRADLAVIADADIVHVGQGDLTPAQARRIVGDDMLIGRSTHALEESLLAIQDVDVDYFAVGPVWPTPTKPGRAAPGLQLVRAVADTSTTKPWFAIGGVDGERVAEVQAAGASRVVVVRALTEAAMPTQAAAQLRAAIAG